MSPSIPKNCSSAESTKVIVCEEERNRLRSYLTDRGYDYSKASAFIARANSAAVHAYVLSGKFPSIGEEKAWCSSVLKEIDRLDSKKLQALLEERNDFEDMYVIGQVIAQMRGLRSRIKSRRDKLQNLNKRGRREGRIVFIEEMVRLWQEIFHEMPTCTPPKSSGEFKSPFLYVLAEIVRIAEGLHPNSIPYESFRTEISKAKKADEKRFSREFRSQFLK